VAPEAGTDASFAGNTVTWNLNTLDSNTSSELVINVTGALPPGAPSANLTVQASMIADGIPSGDLVVSEDLTLMP
jgi:hypothetical protein